MQNISYHTQLQWTRYNLCIKATHQNIKQRKVQWITLFRYL